MNQITFATLIVSALTSLVLIAGLYIWVGLALSAIFRKTGEESWKGWVPFLNVAILLQLGGFGWWWVLLLIIPGGGVAVYVVMIIACHHVGVRFGYGGGMTVLAALLFPVWASVVAWGSNRWVPAREAAPRGPGPVRTAAPAAPAALAMSWLPSPGTAAPAPAAPATASFAATPPRPAAAPAPAAAPVAPPASAGPASAPRLSAWAAASAAAASAPAAAAPAASAQAAAAPAASAQAASAQAEDDDGMAELRMRHRAPFTGTVQVIPEPADDAPAGPHRGEADPSAHVGNAVPRPSAPIADVPAAPTPAPRPDPWAPPAAAAPATPAQVRSYDPTGFSDTSGEVSAVAGAPSLGAPMSARSSVSALRQAPEFPEPDETFDETIIAVRKRTPWMLVPPLGAPISILQDVLILGRRPSSDPDFPSAQLISIVDDTRTVSKTHARIELKDGTWVITDLDSTNGVVIIDDDGSEIEAEPHRPLPIIEAFLLGDAELRFIRDGA